MQPLHVHPGLPRPARPPGLPAVRVGFYTGDKPGSKKSSSKSSSSSGSSSSEVWTQDVLNLGVSPARLVAAARRRFEAAGGLVLERTPLSGVWVHPDGVCLQLGDGSDSSGGSAPARQQLTARLLLDSMGHASPIVQQVRWGQKPDGVCLVVGSCARGFDADANTTGDVIFTTSHSQPPAPASGSAAAAAAAQQGVFNTQLFWEAFPAGSGPSDRTTYLFTYIDAQVRIPSGCCVLFFRRGWCVCLPAWRMPALHAAPLPCCFVCLTPANSAFAHLPSVCSPTGRLSRL